jgi:lipid-A-disaccharide synthase
MTKVMIICAENSGDLLASELVVSLKQECQDIQFTDSLVGTECQKQGMTTIDDLSKIAKMGFFEIITLLPTIYALRTKIINVIATQKPEAIIMVDGFALTHFMAKKIKKIYPHIKIIKYIAPKLWAWASWRAYKLRSLYDLILVCLPFEGAFFAKKNIPTVFVGHSVTQRIHQIDTLEKQALKEKYHIPPNKKIIILLAGSRHSEISRLLPVFLETAKKFDTNNHHFIVPIASGKEHYFDNLPTYYTRITDTQERFKIFQIADAALAASGTVSLELMICHVPTIIAYKVSWLTSKLAHYLIKVPYVTLLNIMMNKEIYPEFLQENCTDDKLYKALYKALYDPETIDMQKKYCAIATDLLYAKDNQGNKIHANLSAARYIKKIF